ncbi:MAG TPA: NAD(P)H-binding protein, partial [Actinotalea sp.]|nr:NAD(P)H-binding protein [Actinotalea sp.]
RSGRSEGTRCTFVTGATGQLGPLVVEELIRRGVPADQLVAAGRQVSRLAVFAERGLRACAIDYDQPASLGRAFDGVHTLVLVSGTEVSRRVQQHASVVEAAGAAGVARLLYTSIAHADTSELAMAPDHRATEQLVAGSGLAFTVARHNWYTENYEQSFAQAAATGVVVTSTGSGRVASASRADYAAALAVLALDDSTPPVVEVAGDVAWSFDEFAEAASQVAGRAVVHRAVGPEEHAAMLAGAGLDEHLAGFLVALDAGIARGDLADATGEVSRLTGRPSTPLVETMRSWAG